MTTIFNLDLNKKNDVMPYAYRVPSNTQVMHFRIIEDDYIIDYERFKRLSLSFIFENDSIKNDTLYSTNTVTYQNEKVVAVNIPSELLDKVDKCTVTPTVELNNKTVRLNSFIVYLYEIEFGSCAENNMNNVLNSISSFNYMLSQFYNAIKRNQINQPNGVIGLDSDGNIPISYFSGNIPDHVSDKLIDTTTKTFLNDSGVEIGIHGMKLDEKWRLRYYDSDDEEWYVANSIHGGKFGYSNKSSEWNVFGGGWGSPTIDARLFTTTLNDFVDGGTFNDSLSGEIDANFIDGGIETGENIFGGSFK